MDNTKYIYRRVSDFSLRPGPRYREQGNYSGEEFYDDCLKPWFEEALVKHIPLNLVLDGTDGYLSSFLDESFGRLVYDFSEDKVKKNLVISSHQEPYWVTKLVSKTFPNWEQRRLIGNSPKTTFATL